jgi:LmbE family N-acetylglucosaminyl deacetylase
VTAPIHPDERALPLQLAEEIRGLLEEESPGQAETVLVAPLAVGNHVDHQLLHAAARALEAAGWTVLWYEDYPYSDPARHNPSHRLNPVARRLAALGFGPTTSKQAAYLVENVDASLEKRITSVEAYESQVRDIFEGRARIRHAISAYAAWVAAQSRDGAGATCRFAERFWRLSPQ